MYLNDFPVHLEQPTTPGESSATSTREISEWPSNIFSWMTGHKSRRTPESLEIHALPETSLNSQEVVVENIHGARFSWQGLPWPNFSHQLHLLKILDCQDIQVGYCYNHMRLF